MAKMLMKFGMAPSLSIGQHIFPSSLHGGVSFINEPSNQDPIGSLMQLATKALDHKSQDLPRDGNSTSASKSPPLNASYGGRTEEVISNFLHNPMFKDEDNELNEMVCDKHKAIMLADISNGCVWWSV